MIVRYFEAGLAQANGLMWRIGGASLVLVPDLVQLKVRGGLGLQGFVKVVGWCLAWSEI